MKITTIFTSPYREYILSVILVGALGEYYLLHETTQLVLGAALLGSILPARDAFSALRSRRITIEAFNFFALFVSFITGEYTSAAFIALMLTVASWLDWKTATRTFGAVEALLRLKPTKALRETIGQEEIIDAEIIKAGDILIVKEGDQIPADGVVIFGSALVNEASLTGESKPLEKAIGDEVYSSTVSEGGIIKIQATKVGQDSTLERMAVLIAEAAKNKSRAERLADRFAGIFLPLVLLAGVITYIITGNILMTAALFLIVCADDIAVSIPLAITAALGYAAKRGVIIKGGEWIRSLATIRTLVFDKTGTLTQGSFVLVRSEIDSSIGDNEFWTLVASVEKFSEHPVGKALYREARRNTTQPLLEPTDIKVLKGVGIVATVDGREVAIGNDAIVHSLGYVLDTTLEEKLSEDDAYDETSMSVFLNRRFVGKIGIADAIKGEASTALASLQKMGIRTVMLTGDKEAVARSVAKKLGLSEYYAEMTPETKLETIEQLSSGGALAMVGDGINDAPALARSDVGIAMGSKGTAVAVEAANIILVTDRLDRIVEMIALAKRTVSVVNADMGIWLITNVIGIALVFTGIATPAFAALYNLLTDFIPMINSARLFRQTSAKE